jgi:uncharacterized protein (DUF885 family)
VNRYLFSVLLLIFAAAGCDRPGSEAPQTAQTPVAAASAPAAADAKAEAAKALHQVFDDFWEKTLGLNPVFATFVGDNRFNDRYANDIGPEWLKATEDLARDSLARVQAIDPDLLEGQDRLSYDVFVFDREVEIEGFRFPSELQPINQFFSDPSFFATMGSGQSLHPFKTVKDYDDWLSRIDGFTVWMDQSIVNMRLGMEKGVVQPRILMEKTLPQLADIAKDKPEDTVFWGPIQNFPEAFTAEEKKRLTAAYKDAIANKLVPSYRKVHDFIRDEYLPKTRDTVGLNALPDGAAWYAYLVWRVTTTKMDPQQIHDIGLAEVARIHGEIRKVMQEVGFKGDMQAFFRYMNEDPKFFATSREQLLDAYRTLKPKLAEAAPKLFATIPKADFEVRKVEEFREKSAAGGYYMAPSPDGSRPGVFYVNTYDLKARPLWGTETLYLHEAVPGHHFQGALTLELTDLPKFRQFGGYTAYAEGWGLYAETLGRELGMYADPYQYFGTLDAELWRAIRLVVDTGLHYKGWTRQQVLDYMYANSATTETDAVAEAERFMAIPGQALAYKLGQMKITELRHRAEQIMGDQFDVRAFHDQVLLDGELPMDALEKKIDRWIAATGAVASTH